MSPSEQAAAAPSAASGGGPVLPPGAAAAVRAAFARAGYTADGVLATLGADGHRALERGEGVPGLRRTAGLGTPLATLVRLFLLQTTEPADAVKAAVPLDALVEGGILAQTADGVRALVDLRPYGADDGPEGGWYVAGDLDTRLDVARRGAEVRQDHVLGVGGASATLAQLVPRTPVGRALDLGTGGGVQVLHLSRHAEHVVATDVLPRALAFARLTAELNGLEVELREGSLVEPVAGEAYDLVVSNPPFVIGAPDVHTYRDAGLPLDTLGEQLLRDVPPLLSPGGTFVMIGDWVRRAGDEPHARVRSWLPPEGYDALVVVRDEEDPAAYVSTWLRDAGEHTAEDALERYDRWLAGLEDARVEAVEFGWVLVRRHDEERVPHVEVLEWAHPVEQPVAPWLTARLDAAVALAALDDAALLATPLQGREDVAQELHGAPGDEDPESVVLRQARGLRQARSVGTEAAGLVGACDGTIPLGALVEAVAQVLELDPDELRAALLPQVRELVRDGFLVLPAG
ncbi:methyltransferase family protein [Motilibacter rhizosphaerae]|uniref:Methyltransferase family protein n=1 Tax=Motilibacter rhizosphaerae TaxID=598652 RepID=A0A4Q7NAC7_9ACTN|nr:methyltransferase [Motilibacter rhizosphaerae]RZS79398.1 methyltransferase family protein [Motilibacter rhizosphaerae]